MLNVLKGCTILINGEEEWRDEGCWCNWLCFY